MNELENSSNNRMIWEGAYEDNQKWRDDLTKKASFKSLGITEDMGDIGSNNTTHNYGGGIKSMVMGAALAAGGMGVCGLLLNHFLDDPAKPIERIIEHEKIIDYEVRMEVTPPE